MSETPYANEDLSAEFEQLRDRLGEVLVENAKLRAALEEIRSHLVPEGRVCQDIARSALAEQDR